MKPYIIAEVGSNFTTLYHLMQSIRAAKNSGADAVKFQLYHPIALYGMDKLIPGMVTLPEGWLTDLKIECDNNGIDFMCSAFSPELYDVVNPYVKTHKVASAELTHVRILEKLKSYGKPVILSTGASGLADISAALRVLGETPVTLMYCVASYPANEIYMEMVDILRDRFGLPVGFSDHSLDYICVPRLAMSHGVTVIEKHFKLNDNMKTPDSPHSLNPDQFAKMVKALTEKKTDFAYSGTEQDMILRHNRRLKAIKDIKVGEKLIEGENFGIYRSLNDDPHAFSPFMVDKINGMTAKNSINAGDGIGPRDI